MAVIFERKVPTTKEKTIPRKRIILNKNLHNDEHIEIINPSENYSRAYLLKDENINSSNSNNQPNIKLVKLTLSIITVLLFSLLFINAIQIIAKTIKINNNIEQIISQENTINTLQEQATNLTSESSLTAQAINLDMGTNIEIREFVLLTQKEQEKKEIRTNWFDIICDYLSNLFKD